MRIIDIQEIIDYSKCPMYYFLKHKKEIEVEEVDIEEKYESSLLKIILFSFCKIQDNDFIRVEDIKQMWGKAWVKDKRKSDMIFSESFAKKDDYNIKRVNGLNKLLDFRQYLINDSGYPIAINQDYKYKLGNILIKGRFDVVREVRDDRNLEIQTCVFKVDNSISKVSNKYDMKLISDIIAIHTMVKEDIKVTGMIYNIDKNKAIAKKNIPLSKDMFEHNVKTIVNLIDNNVFYMSVNERCNTCVYKNMCCNSKASKLLLDNGGKK